MSRSNVEIVRDCWAAWGDRDIDRLVARWAPAIEWDMSRFDQWTEGDRYCGHAELLAFLGAWMAGWSSYDVQSQEIVANGQHVLVHVWHRGVRHGESEPIEEEWAMVWTLRAGEVIRIQVFSSREEAQFVSGLVPVADDAAA
jgi:ketosteroid isomerase-like protein